MTAGRQYSEIEVGSRWVGQIVGRLTGKATSVDHTFFSGRRAAYQCGRLGKKVHKGEIEGKGLEGTKGALGKRSGFSDSAVENAQQIQASSLVTTFNSMSTDLPTEMWAYIFSFSCMDDGRTGCALLRVSKHFRELSKPFRLTSICLYGSEEILQFEAAITPLPPNERRIRYLHITTPHLLLDVSKDEDDDDYDEIGESDCIKL